MSDQEVFVVVSKLKKYVKETAGMNTAGSVAGRLSEIIRNLTNQAIENAKADGRKTLMDRDYSSV